MTTSTSPLTDTDRRRLAALQGVAELNTITDYLELQALADWVLDGEPAPAAETSIQLFIDGVPVSDAVPPSTGLPTPTPHVWAEGDVVRLNEPSPAPDVADAGQGDWRVAEVRGFSLWLRNPRCSRGIVRRPHAVTLVTPAGGAA